ncbi:MAG: S8 family serine peptidase, partial [Sedimentisphaerales bacterium]|nr:S8 family serine peptidase [Sedimentisphaerales bacterium]
MAGALCILALSLSAAADDFTPLQPLGLNHAGVYALRNAVPALTGKEVNIALVCRSITYLDETPLNDYRPDFAHRCLQNTPVTFYDSGHPLPGISPHDTAIASILFGRDPNASAPGLGRFNYEGVTPDAIAAVYQFDYFISSNVIPQIAPPAKVISASFGDEFEWWWTRGIEALVEHKGLIFVAGIGNGADALDPPLYPAAGANVIGVGVVDSVDAHDIAAKLANFALASPEHSSFGPTGSGRCKPDIVAPGNCLVAEANDPNGYTAAGDFSSFATPVVAGTVGLLIQKARLEPALEPAISGNAQNCVIKAVLLNSATKLPYWHKGLLTADDDHSTPLDYTQGAGMVNAKAACDQLSAGVASPGNAPALGWDKNTLRADAQPYQVYRITLPEPAGKRITATAVWNNHYADSYPFAALTENDADLRLELWAVDANDPDSDYLLDYSDSPLDNVEHIYCQADANYTDYEIVLLINDLNNPALAAVNQHYALAWNAGAPAEDDSIFWYDLNSDGIVDGADFAVLMDNWVRCREKNE